MKEVTYQKLWLYPPLSLQMWSQSASSNALCKFSTSISFLNWSWVPNSIRRGTFFAFPDLTSSVESYSFPSSSGFSKKNWYPLVPQLGDTVGLEIGAKAEADLNYPVLRAVIRAPCPPILKPVTDLLHLSTGKNEDTSSGSSLVRQENILKCFLDFSEVASTQQLAELPHCQSASIPSMPVFLGLVSGNMQAILCFFAKGAKPDFNGKFSWLQVSPARQQRAGYGFPLWCFTSSSGKNMPKVISPFTSLL